MRAMLDAHPDIRCGEETRILPNIIGLTNSWLNKTAQLKKNGISNKIIESALGSFVLEIVKNHGKPAKYLCNKDPFVLRYSVFVKRTLPKSKFILMIRDGRATVHSIITRKVTVSGFNMESYKDSLIMWSKMIEAIYEECVKVGPEWCLPVNYEQLILHPEKNMKKILSFLKIPFNNAVLNHEQFIGDEISLSKVERSSDQVIKPINLEALNSWVGKIPNDVVAQMDKIAPMLRRLGYDPMANPPNYGKPDEKIKKNTLNIKLNSEYWERIAKKYSIHVNDS
jgi:protein-tyrosine sulfotransferase